MTQLSRTIRQGTLAIALALLSTVPILPAQNLNVTERLAKAVKSGNTKDVFSTLHDLGQNAKRHSAAVRDRRGQTTPESKCSSGGHCPQIVTIDYPGAVLTLLSAINDAGEIIGYYLDTANTVRSFIREPDGTYVTVEPQGAGTGPGTGTIIWSINEQGDVTGGFADSPTSGHAYVRTRQGKYTQIDVGAPGDITVGLDINAEDTVAGQYIDSAGLARGYLRFRNGTVETFSVPGAGGTGCSDHSCGTVVTTIDGLNPENDVVGGYFDDANVLHGLLRYRGGNIVVFDVDNVGAFPLQGTSPSGINQRLEIPGFYVDRNGVNHAFIRSADGSIETFDVTGAGNGSGQGTFANNINREGDIVGYYVDATGASFGFLRSHVDGRIQTFGIPDASIVFPNYNNTTNAIVGYYADANNILHGFLRTP